MPGGTGSVCGREIPCAAAQFPEKIFEKIPAGFRQNAAFDLNAMVVTRRSPKIDDAATGAAFWLDGTVDHARNAGIEARPQAHGARFQGHIQGAVFQPPGTQGLTGGGDGHHFGMGRGILKTFAGIPTAADDLALVDENRTHGHFPILGGSPGLRQGQLHPRAVVRHFFLTRVKMNPRVGKT